MKKKIKKQSNNEEVKFQRQTERLKQTTTTDEDYKTIRSFFIALVVIAVIIGLLYYFNGRFVTKDKFQGEATTTTTTTVAYDGKIRTVNNIFGVSNDTYYVLLYSSEESSNILYSGLVNGYTSDDIDLFYVDMSKASNKKNYDTKGEENTKPTSASDLVITKPTLLVFKKGKVSSYITDTDKIISYLK